MFYSDEVIMDVRHGNDIVDVVGDYVKLTRKGANYFGLCPFHGEKTASFSVNRDKQIFHCFGCGVGGDVFKFIKLKENMSFSEAIEFLAKRINYRLPDKSPSRSDTQKRELKEKLWDIHKTAARFYYDCLNDKNGDAARRYLDRREVTKPIRNKFGLGYAPDDWDALNRHLLAQGYDQDIILKSGLVKQGKTGRFYDNFRNRLMFPIIDIYGHIIAFGGRALNKEDEENGRKYINSPETEIYSKSFNPYNINFARLAHSNEMIVVEGYMDALSLYQAGFKNVIASLGTAFNDNHASVIKRYAKTVIALFDSDDSGERAALRSIPVLQRAGLKVKILQVTDAKDPDEYIKKFGAEAFSKLLKTAQNQIIFRVNVLKKQYSLNDPDDLITFTQNVVEILSEIDNMTELDVYINEITKDLPISAEAVRADVLRIRGTSDTKPAGEELGRRVKNVIVNNALEDAKSALINLLAKDKNIFERTKAVFDKKEFGDDLYIKIYDIIERLHEKGKPILEADIISLLDLDDNEDTAKRAALIFMQQLPYETDEQKHTALTGALKMIKNHYIDTLISKTDDDNTVMELLAKKKSINNSNYYNI